MTELKKILKSKRDKKDDSDSSQSDGSSGEEWPELMTITSDLGGSHGSVTTNTMASLRELGNYLCVLLDMGCINTLISSKYFFYKN